MQPWASTSSLNTIRAGASVIAVNGYIYAMSGFPFQNTVEYARINADGSLGAWSYTSSTNTTHGFHGVAAGSGGLFAVGGSNGSQPITTVEFAPINADGTLGPWTVEASLNTPRHDLGVAGDRGYIYAVGGTGETDQTDGLSSVEFIAASVPTFILIDSDSISDGANAIKQVANAPGLSPSEMVNDHIARVGLRVPLGIPVGTTLGAPTTAPLRTGQVGDEGWFALKSTPASWDTAGPKDGLHNFLDAANGLGTGSNPEALLDKIPDVTPLRTAGLKMLLGQRVCALVYDSDISINYGPLQGSLKGANLGLIAFDVLAVREPNGSVLPDVTIQVIDATSACGGSLQLLQDAPTPTSTSQPSP